MAKNTSKKRRRNPNSKLAIAKDIFLRIVATFVASALGVIGAGALLDIDIWIAAAMGGVLAVARVVEKLAIGFIEDGRLDRDEIDAIFSDSVQLKHIGEHQQQVADQQNAKK